MDLLLFLTLLTVVALTYLARSERASARRVRQRAVAVRHAFRKFNADNIELWERYLRSLRPWESNRR